MERDPEQPAANPGEGSGGGGVYSEREGRRRERQTRREQEPGGNMLPARGRRRLGAERLLVRVIATIGIIGVDVVIAAILASSKTQGWIVGLVTGIVAVVLSAILWSSRQV